MRRVKVVGLLLVLLVLLLRIEVVLRLLVVMRGNLLSHHVGRVLKHLIGHIELSLLVNVVGLSSLANIDVPQTQHLVALNLNLSFAIASSDCSAILLNTLVRG